MLFIAVSTLCLAETAWSQEPAAAFTCPERPDKQAKARKMAGAYFAEAEQAFDEALYEQALEKFVCSLVMTEHENTVTNIERTLEQLPDRAAALPILKTYDSLGPNGEFKTRIDELIADIEATLAAAKPEEPAEACPASEPSPPPPCPPSPLPGIEIEYHGRLVKTATVSAWAGIGVGAASFVSAIVFQALAGSAKNSAQSAVDYDLFLDERDKNKSFQTAATTLFVTSILTSAVGVVELFVLSEQQKRYAAEKKGPDKSTTTPSPSTTVSLVPGIGHLELEVRF